VQKADIEALLKKDLNGSTVEGHLLKVLDALITKNRNDAYNAFEVVSRFVKSEAPKDDGPGEAPDVEAAVTKALAVRKAPADAEGAELPLKGVPDIRAELELTKWAGFGFSITEVQALSNSFRHLASKESIEKVRFWGKILGTGADYYVAEGRGAGDEEGAEEGVEAPGDIGVNFYTYWVTTDLHAVEADWVKLPLATAAHLVASRKGKKILTGDLEAPVITHPHFPGKEKHLLRAMIADISADTILVPKGYLRRPEGAEDERAVEEVEQGKEEGMFQFPLAKKLVSLDAWVHAREHIRESGKTTKPAEPEGEGEGEEGADPGAAKRAYDEEMRLDPWMPAIQEVSKDPAPEGMKKVWSVTPVYDPTERAVEVAADEGEGGEGAKTTQISSYSVVAVKSLLWPGAVCVSQGTEFVNLYVGYGHKVRTYFPVAPPAVLDEPPDMEEMPEPTPLEEPPAEEAEAEGETG